MRSLDPQSGHDSREVNLVSQKDTWSSERIAPWRGLPSVIDQPRIDIVPTLIDGVMPARARVRMCLTGGVVVVCSSSAASALAISSGEGSAWDCLIAIPLVGGVDT